MPPVEVDAHDVTSCDAHDASTKKAPAALSLCDAVTAGNLELVNQLLDEGADPNSLSTDWYKTRPLIIAANAGHASIVRRLLDHPDIQPNLTDGVFGNTALMGACQEGHRDVVRRMIAHPKVDIKFQTAKTGTTALMEASRYGHADVVAMLIGENPATEDLGGVNLQTKAGTTALMLSCMAHRDKVLWGARHVKLILGVGALDINIKDNQGRNAEDWSRDKNLEYVKKLIKEASVHNIGGGEARVEMLQLREKVEELENLLDKSENEKKVLQRKLDKILEERNTKDVGAGGDSDEISTKDVGAGGDCDEISTKDVGAGGDLARVTTKDAAAGGENLDEVTNDLAAQAL